MILFKQAGALEKYLSGVKKQPQIIGFVPTMGALHKGHISLISESKKKCTLTVCTIFINPTQFNDPADFEKYPVTIEKDILLLEQSRADIVFMPSVAEMYPEGLQPPLHYNIGYLEDILEGFYRPGHFQGVCRVLHKFITIIKPDIMFMGRKDYQQCMVVKKLLELYAISTTLHIVDTLREKDGLAMSSRNMRLNESNRQKALVIYRALNFIKQNITTAPIADLKEKAVQMILEEGFSKVDYVEVCDATTLLPATGTYNHAPLVALAAAFIGGVRLIDNLLVT